MKQELARVGAAQSLAEMRDKVVRLENAIREELPPVDVDELTDHYFADGIYLRCMTIPAGVVVVGKIHKTRHLTIVVSGTVRITTDDGVYEIKGPAVFVSEPGAKKACYAVTDAVVMNPHPTDSTDLEEIEEQFIAPSFEALAHFTAPRLEGQEEETKI